MKLLEVKNLSFGYKNCGTPILNNVSFSADEGELILVCGATACGKTTLLRNLKPELAPFGEKSGGIFFCGTSLEKLDKRESAEKIGYVMQRPENQTVTDTVRSEIAFCGESLGLPRCVIQRQVAETAAYFGLEKILDSKTTQLSGGQRQLLNLAAVMAVKPSLIILDEPTAQLDPIASGELLRTVYRISRELSVTVIIAEHRFGELLPLCDKILMLENGAARCFSKPSEAAAELVKNSSLNQSLPCGLRIWGEYCSCVKCNPPLTLSAGREMISQCFDFSNIKKERKPFRESESAVRLKNISFAYSSEKNDVIRSASLDVKKGEIFALLGSNGSGKSTLLSVICGPERPYRGTVEIKGKQLKKYKPAELYGGIAALLPQDVQSTFLNDTVGEELNFTENTDIYDFRSLYDAHPYDLSGGQQQLLGIKKLLISNPEILLLDEPTKGLDGSWRNLISGVVKNLKSEGRTVIIVTHDTELVAECADRCGIFFDGYVTAEGTPYEIFAESLFYTTDAAKLTVSITEGIVSSTELLDACGNSFSKRSAEN